MPSLRGLRLLSLDGGGVRGLSELYILREMMERMKNQNKMATVPCPCEWFDMIAGSNTGGIIALLLGRLRMPVDEAILAYTSLSEQVFSDTKWVGKQKYKSSKLEEVLKDIIREKTGSSETKMMVESKCKVFVCSMPAHHVAPGIPCLFRTYVDGTGANESYDCTVWEAARATSAFPELFKPIEIGPPGLREPFVDGGLGCNNPLDILSEEAYRCFPERHISCIVSLGTGLLAPISALSTDLTDALQNIVLDCESIANEAELRFKEVSDLYFRFSVSSGMEDVPHHDWDKTVMIKAHTDRYLCTVAVTTKMFAAVKVVGSRQLGKISTVRLRRMRNSIIETQSILSSSARQSSMTSISGYHNDQSGSNDEIHNPIPAANTTISPIPEEATTVQTIMSTTSRLGREQDQETDISPRPVIAPERRNRGSHPFTLKVKHNLARYMLDQCRYSEAEAILTMVWKIREGALGKEHPDTLRAAEDLAESLCCQAQWAKAEDLYRNVLVSRRKVGGDEDEHSSDIKDSLADALYQQGRHVEAEGMWRSVLATRSKVLGEEHPDTLRTVDDLAETSYEQCRYMEAEEMWRRVLAARSKVPGEDHSDTLLTEDSLANSIHCQGRYAEAERVYEIVVAKRSKILGDTHPDVLRTENNLASAIHSQRRYMKAEQTWRRVLATQSNVLGEEHPDTLRTGCDLASAVGSQGRDLEAEGMLRRVLTAQSKVLGEEHPETLRTEFALASAVRNQGRHMEAEEMCRRVGEVRSKVLGEEHPDTLRTENDLASAVGNQGRHMEAEKMYRRLLAAQSKILGEEHPDTLSTEGNLARAVRSQGRHMEAQKIWRRIAVMRKKAFRDEHLQATASHIKYEVATKVRQGRYVQAKDM